ncbi:hypothetical protein [Caenispirillum salinarum]|uniref:hypothetical protein n=1 Tax=Caenispirillum salinarum TaxID=859058 RepID=UPI00384ED558
MRSDDGATLTLHIGIPKTASTWLQDVLFPQLPGIKSIPVPTSRLFDETEDRDADGRLWAGCLRRSAALWPVFGDAVFAEMLGPKEPWLAAPRDVVVSEEGIGRAGSRPEQLAAHLAAVRIHAQTWGFTRLKVICLLRRQDHWLASHYAQMSDRYADPGQAGFEDLVDKVARPDRGRFMLGMMLDYGALLGAVADAVGSPNVLALPYEFLVNDPAAFRQALLEFLRVADTPELQTATAAETRRNARSEAAGLWRLQSAVPRSLPRRVRGRLARSLGLPDPPPEPATIAVTPAITHRLLSTFADANRQADRYTAVRLGPFGYLEAGAILGPARVERAAE